LRGSAGAFAVTLAEFLNATRRVNDFLFAGIKRMAGGAHFDMKRATQCRTRFKGIATAAGDFDFGVFRMNIGFHKK
jgi:hypothetical protein